MRSPGFRFASSGLRGWASAWGRCGLYRRCAGFQRKASLALPHDFLMLDTEERQSLL